MDVIQKHTVEIYVYYQNYFLTRRQCFMMSNHFGFMFWLNEKEVF